MHTGYPLGSELYLLLIRTTSFPDLLCPLANGAVWGLARAGKCLECVVEVARRTPALGHTVPGSYLGLCTWEVRRAAGTRLLGAKATPPAGPCPRALGGGAPGRPQQAGGGDGSASASRQRLSLAWSERRTQRPAQPGAQRQRQARSVDREWTAGTTETAAPARVQSARPGPAAGSGSVESGPRVECPTLAVDGVVGTVPRRSGLRRCQRHWARESGQGPLQIAVPNRNYDPGASSA